MILLSFKLTIHALVGKPKLNLFRLMNCKYTTSYK